MIPAAHDEEISVRTKDEVLMLRRAFDKHLAQRLDTLEARLGHMETRLDDELRAFDQQMTTRWMEEREAMMSFRVSLDRIITNQSQYAPALDTVQRVIHSGMVMRWMIVAVVSVLAAVGTFATAWDIIRGVAK